MVAIFLHILTHDVKNRIVRSHFARSSETVSRHFNVVLLAVLKTPRSPFEAPIHVRREVGMVSDI